MLVHNGDVLWVSQSICRPKVQYSPLPLAVLNRVVFHQDGAIPHNARINFVFLNHLNNFDE
jgi:hypothetical protein